MFLLWLHLFILSGVVSPLFSSSILGTYQPEEFIFQCPIFLPFLLFMGFSRQEYWSGLPFPSLVDHILSELSTMTRQSLVGLHRDGLVSLSKARLWSMWLDQLVFCGCAFNLSVLWFPLSASTMLLGFLLPWTWGISSQLLKQSAATAPYLGRGISPHGHSKWPSM